MIRRRSLPTVAGGLVAVSAAVAAAVATLGGAHHGAGGERERDTGEYGVDARPAGQWLTRKQRSARKRRFTGKCRGTQEHGAPGARPRRRERDPADRAGRDRLGARWAHPG